MGKKHFPPRDPSQEEPTTETPPSFSRVTPLEIPLTSTLPYKSGILHGKRRRTRSDGPICKGDQGATYPLLPRDGEQPSKKRKEGEKEEPDEEEQVKRDTLTTSLPSLTKTETTDDKLTEYQDKFQPFDSYHWDNDDGAYRKRTGSMDEVADKCEGTDWLHQSEERHAEALSYKERDLSDDVGAPQAGRKSRREEGQDEMKILEGILRDSKDQ